MKPAERHEKELKLKAMKKFGNNVYSIQHVHTDIVGVLQREKQRTKEQKQAATDAKLIYSFHQKLHYIWSNSYQIQSKFQPLALNIMKNCLKVTYE